MGPLKCAYLSTLHLYTTWKTCSKFLKETQDQAQDEFRIVGMNSDSDVWPKILQTSVSSNKRQLTKFYQPQDLLNLLLEKFLVQFEKN